MTESANRDVVVTSLENFSSLAVIGGEHAVVMDEPKVGARDGGMVSAPVFREIAQNILQEMKVATDAPVKPEGTVAQNIPEQPVTQAPIKNGTDKKAASAKPESKSKSADVPANKNKKPDLKKTNEKKFGEPGKLTAILERRFGQKSLDRKDETKIET